MQHATPPTRRPEQSVLVPPPWRDLGTSLTPRPRGPAPVQRAPFHLKRQGLMTQRMGIDEERHATPNLEAYFSSQSLILLRLSSSGGRAELETRWLLIPAPPTPCSSMCQPLGPGAGWGHAGCPPGPAGRACHPHPGGSGSCQPPGLSASPPPAELGDPAVASRPALCSWRGQQLSRPRKETFLVTDEEQPFRPLWGPQSPLCRVPGMQRRPEAAPTVLGPWGQTHLWRGRRRGVTGAATEPGPGSDAHGHAPPVQGRPASQVLSCSKY